MCKYKIQYDIDFLIPNKKHFFESINWNADELGGWQSKFKTENYIDSYEISSLQKKVFTTQINYKRTILINGIIINLNFIDVKYLNAPNDKVIDNLFIVNIKTNKEASNSKELETIINVIKSKFSACKMINSIYEYGIKLFNEINWNTKNLYKNDIEWQKNFDTLRKDIIGLLRNQTNNNYEHIYTEIDKLLLYATINNHSDIFDIDKKKMLNQILFVKNKFCQSIFNKENLKHKKNISQGQIIYNEIYDKDIKFINIFDINNNQIKLTKANYSNLLGSRDRVVRKSAFNSLYKSYSMYKNTIAKCLDLHISQDNHIPFRNDFKSIDECTFYSKMLINISNENLKYLHKYMKYRKVQLDIDDYSIFDIQCSIFNNSAKINYVDAKNIILNALSVLGNEYIDKCMFLFENGLIDAFHRDKKRTGSYTTTSYNCKTPYISLEFENNIQSIISMAHELGHAVASMYLSNIDEYSNISPILSEIHGSINESLVVNYLYNQSYEGIGEYYIEKYRAQFYRQMLLSEFEVLIHDLKKNSSILTSSLLSSEYILLLEKYYGKEVILPKGIEIEWAKIKFYFNCFYSFNYPSSFMLGEVIAELLNSNNNINYINILKSTTNLSQFLQFFNIDIFDEDIYQPFFLKFKNLLNETFRI